MKTENIAEIVGAIIAGIFTFYFYTSNETAFALIACIVAFLLLFLFLKGILNKEEPFVERMNRILKTYDSILVEIECFPKLNDKKIVKAKYFKDLVNVQFDLRKPIYYYKEEECCNFLILSTDTAYVYVMKKNREYTSKLELLVDTQNLQNMKKFEIIENFEMPKKEEVKAVEEKKPEIKEETTTENNNGVHFYKDLDPDELAMFNDVISFKNDNNDLNEIVNQEEQDSSHEENNQNVENQNEEQDNTYEENNQNVENQNEEQDNTYEENNQNVENQNEEQNNTYEENNQNVENQNEEQDNTYESYYQNVENQNEEQDNTYEDYYQNEIENPYVESYDEEKPIIENISEPEYSSFSYTNFEQQNDESNKFETDGEEFVKDKSNENEEINNFDQIHKVENNSSNKKNKQLTIEKYEIDHVNKKSNKHNYRPYDDTMANLSEDELDKQFEDLLNELNDLDVE